MNLLQLSDHVVKSCHWSDGGSEFVFMDGTILSFADHMNTFVAISASDPKKPKNFMVTSLCLSDYESKVTAALAVFNRFSVQPRLIHSLCQQEEQLWTHHAPIETVVLSDDSSLFSRIAVISVDDDAMGRTTLGSCSKDSVDTSNANVYGMQLYCAMRKVRLTVHASRQVFFVRWPARVSERDGSTCIFVRNALSGADSYASQKAVRFVWLEQMFFVDCCPPEWSEMLRLCFELDRRVPMEGTSADGSAAPVSTILGATPETLGAPLITSTYFAKSVPGAAGLTRFSSIEPDHAHYFVAAAHLYTISPMAVLHPAKKGVTLQWMLDHDLSNKSPVTFYSAQGSSVSAFVFEDDAVIRLSTSMRQSATQPFILKLHRVIQQLPMPSASSEAPTRIAIEEKEYMQDATLSIPLPKSINVGNFAPLLGTFAMSRRDARDASSLSLTRGRYVPFVAESLVGISRRNAEAQCASNITQSLGRIQDNGELGSIVKLSSRIDSVGNFTALTNGVVRCHFDDRTIMTLIPDERDTEEGLVVEMRTRDAELVVCRVDQASTSAHSMKSYLEYLLPFRHFAKLRSTDYFVVDRFLPETVAYQRAEQISLGDSAQVDLIVLKGAVCMNNSDEIVERSKALLRRVAQI